MINIIAACSKNRVIGKDNKLIWHIPDDLKRFKELTLNSPVMMGRKTFESIGRPLPKRQNIVLTKDRNWNHPGCLAYSDWRDVLPIFENQNLWVIGGSQIYEQLMPYADRIELTLIDREFEGDSLFPEIDPKKWKLISEETRKSPEFDYSFLTYERSNSW